MNMESEGYFNKNYMCPSCGKSFIGFESLYIDPFSGMAECLDCKQQVAPVII